MGVNIKSDAVFTGLHVCNCSVTFANKVKYASIGHPNVQNRYVNPATAAGAEAIKRQQCKWPELANNDQYLTVRGKHYAPGSSVGTSATGTVSAMMPAILRTTLLEGAVAPETPPKAKAGGAVAPQTPPPKAKARARPGPRPRSPSRPRNPSRPRSP